MMDKKKKFYEYCAAYDQTGCTEYRDEAIQLYWVLTGEPLTVDEFNDSYVELMYENKLSGETPFQSFLRSINLSSD